MDSSTQWPLKVNLPYVNDKCNCIIISFSYVQIHLNPFTHQLIFNNINGHTINYIVSFYNIHVSYCNTTILMTSTLRFIIKTCIVDFMKMKSLQCLHIYHPLRKHLKNHDKLGHREEKGHYNLYYDLRHAHVHYVRGLGKQYLS